MLREIFYNQANSPFSLPKQSHHWQIPIALAACLVPFALLNMAAFHTFVELFAVCIAVMSFVVTWHTFSFARNHFLLVLGCGYFWVGVIDLFHTLTFKNIIPFEASSPGTTIQFWIIARVLEAFTLLLAPLTLKSVVNPLRLFFTIGALSFAAILAFFSKLIPDMYIAGTGLTNFKVYSEYGIIAVLLLAAVALSLKRQKIEPSTLTLLLLSIALTIMAELSFTLYSGLNDAPIIIGHLFKLFSFWAIYCALVESSVTRPFYSLYQLVHSYDSISESTVIVDEKGIIQHANTAIKDAKGADIIGKHCHQFLHPSALSVENCPICSAIKDSSSLNALEVEAADEGRWDEVSLSPIYSTELSSLMVHSLRDITERKHTELQFSNLNRLYNMLSRTNQAIVTTEDQDSLYQQVCNIAIDQAGFKMAWIGIIEDDNVKPEFVAGKDSGYFKKIKMRIDGSQWSKGPVGRAANTLTAACVNSVRNDPDFEPWREAALKSGFGSLAAVPLFFNKQLKAIFTLYAEREDVFDEQMLSLLSNLSKDISAAIYNIDQAHQKQLDDVTIRRLSSAVEQSASAIVIGNTDGIINYVNKGFTELTGFLPEEAVGRQALDFGKETILDKSYKDMWEAINQGKAWHGELMSRKKNGDTYWAIQTISPIKDPSGNITHVVSTSTDNTELHEAHEMIQQLAFYDPLTELANRRLLMDRLEHDLASAKRHKEFLAVILCDLDNFKLVNDSLGHDYGDQLLKHVASVFQKHVRDEDTVARLGGDEFVLLLSGDKNEQRITEVVSAILKELKEPFSISNNQISSSSSIGIAVYPQDGQTPSELLRNADLAMYHAKNTGKSRFQFFQQQMNDVAQGRLLLENKIRTAIDNDGFELYYQPQVSMLNNKLVGLEALIRWNDPEDGFIPPDQFIPVAEECGLINAIGDWVIQKAFDDWEALIDLGLKETSVSVNVAAQQFQHSDHLCEVLSLAFKAHPKCEAELFTIELTEGTLIEDIQATSKALETLKKLGISISIDDFGTGYSSLNYLKKLPVDQLKIDKSFIQDMLSGVNDQAIVTAIIIIAQKLNMKLVAEGVETIEQAQFLLDQDCEYAQGYYYHKPLPFDQLALLIKDLS